MSASVDVYEIRDILFTTTLNKTNRKHSTSNNMSTIDTNTSTVSIIPESKKKSAQKYLYLNNNIKDEAVSNEDDQNESAGFSQNNHKLGKTVLTKMKQLESFLFNPDITKNFNNISILIDELKKEQVSTFRTDDFNYNLLHLLVNRPRISEEFEMFLLQLVTKLLDKNCDPNEEDTYGWTALSYCCNYDYKMIAKQLISRPYQFKGINLKSKKQLKIGKYYFLVETPPLQICCWLNHFEMAKMLIENGADIQSRNEAGWTPLHICCRQNYLNFVQYLIDQGANINIGNDHKKFPLHVVARHGHDEIGRILLSYGASVKEVNNYGQCELILFFVFIEMKFS
jgi:ankyrin repeat protein